MTNLEKLAKVFADTFGISEAETKGLQYDEFGIQMDTDDIIDMSSFEKAQEILKKYGIQF